MFDIPSVENVERAANKGYEMLKILYQRWLSLLFNKTVVETHQKANP